jgi:hypothetical protein
MPPFDVVFAFGSNKSLTGKNWGLYTFFSVVNWISTAALLPYPINLTLAMASILLY